MNKIVENIWTEKYRSNTLDELIFNKKEEIKSYLNNPKTIPSFILYSSSPGTGKTSLAYIIARILNADMIKLNASQTNGIDTIRELESFAESVSSNPNSKRIIFFDEADGISLQAQESLRGFIEKYSDNIFFIFTANKIAKISEAIKSRCILYDFSKPSKTEILDKLSYICDKEEIIYDVEELRDLISLYYPDIRSMVKTLQDLKVGGKTFINTKDTYVNFLKALYLHDIQTIYSKAFSNEFDLLSCNKFLFEYFASNFNLFKQEELITIADYLADTEKNSTLGVNLPIIFVSNCLKISSLLKGEYKNNLDKSS